MQEITDILTLPYLLMLRGSCTKFACPGRDAAGFRSTIATTLDSPASVSLSLSLDEREPERA